MDLKSLDFPAGAPFILVIRLTFQIESISSTLSSCLSFVGQFTRAPVIIVICFDLPGFHVIIDHVAYLKLIIDVF
jgi:hypothetical protein